MMRVELYVECDRCGESFTDDLEHDQCPDDALDHEGWMWGGTLLDRLLCSGCYDIEENGEPDPDAEPEEEEPE